MTREQVPTINQCDWEYPPVPRPLFVCWHPASNDQWDMVGDGQTREEAYANMIERHEDWLESERERV